MEASPSSGADTCESVASNYSPGWLLAVRIVNARTAIQDAQSVDTMGNEAGRPLHLNPRNKSHHTGRHLAEVFLLDGIWFPRVGDAFWRVASCRD